MDDVLQLPHVAAGALADMIPAEKTALVVVDVQTDFAAPFGLLGRHGVDLSGVEQAIDRIEAMIAAGRAAGATIAFLRVVTTPQSDSVALKTLYERRGQPGQQAICRSDDGGADFYRVSAEPGDIHIEKRLYDGFHETDLDAQLRGRGIETLLLTGFSTDCCVDETARAAFHLDYHVFIVTDATGAYQPSLHLGALNVLAKNCALLVASDAVLEAWG